MLSNRFPTVSVYVPTYRRPDCLARALNSLANQTYSSIQVLVCEDPSDAPCDQIIEQFRNSFADFVFLRNDRRSGPCLSRNRMIDAADGDYITGLDDDDYFAPNRIEEFVRSPNLTRASFLSSTAAPIDPAPDWFPARDGGRWISFDAMKRANIPGNQIFTKKKLLQEAGAFDPDMPAWQDYDAWFRLAKTFGAGYKIDNQSYKIDLSLALTRITTSSKAHQGFRQFVSKHAADLSPADVIYLQLRDYENRGATVGLKELVRAVRATPVKDKVLVTKDYGKYSFGQSFPGFKRKLLATGLF